MGCGSSALSSDDDANLNGHNNPRRRLRVVRPITDQPITPLSPITKGDNIVIAFPLINNSKEEDLVEEVNKKLVVVTEATTHDDRDDDDDAFNGQSSPSFREYCKNLSLNTPNNISQDSTNDVDDSDSGESTNGIYIYGSKCTFHLIYFNHFT